MCKTLIVLILLHHLMIYTVYIIFFNRKCVFPLQEWFIKRYLTHHFAVTWVRNSTVQDNREEYMENIQSLSVVDSPEVMWLHDEDNT